MSQTGFGGLRNVFTYRRPEMLLFPQPGICTDSDQVLQPFFLCEPPEQVRLFIILFCFSVALGLIANHSVARRFYSMFSNSTLSQSTRRGFGYTACKAYGFIPICKLSETGLCIVGWMLVTTLLLACQTHLAPRFFLFASFGLYFLYFGQLYCESKHGGHGAILFPSVLLLLALSGGPQGSPWSLAFIKIFLGVIYLAGAISKVVISGFFGKRWLGSTMQAYLFDSMWSRPHRLPIVRALQSCILRNWWLCTAMALSGLLFEFLWLPVVLFGGHYGGVIAAVVAIGFHLGVDTLQGLDFKPFWCPVFWVFLPDFQAVLHGAEPPLDMFAILAQGFEEEPCRWMMSAAYVLLEAIVALRFMDCFEGMECLPLTCCPMFALPRNLFGDELRGGVLTDLDLRGGGHVDFAYNFFPWVSDMPMTNDDLKQIPGRALFWLSTSHCPPQLTRLVQKEFQEQDFLLAANFEVSLALKERLQDLLRVLEDSQPDDWSNREKVDRVISLQIEIRSLFEAHPPLKTPASQLQELRDSAELRSAIKGVGGVLDWLLAFSPTELHPYVAC